MKTKTKSILKVISTFLAGIAVGIVTMGYLSMRASKTFVEVLRSNYHTEQMKMAAKAHNDGDTYSEFIYRNNVVNVSPFGKATTFNSMKNTWTFGFPFAAPILDRITDFSCLEKGRNRVYGIELGQLAEATENIGLKEEAEKLWEQSAKLTEIKDMTKLRSFIAGIHKIEDGAKAEKSKK
jgi:hypothetical protein